MTCEEAKNLMADYLFGTLESEKKAALEAHLQDCSACREEIRELQETAAVLQKWEDVHPKQRIVFVEPLPQRSGFLEKMRAFLSIPHPVRWAVALAVFVFILFGISRTQISYRNGQFDFALGESLRKNQIVASNLMPILQQYHVETLNAVSQLIKQNANLQQQNLLLAIDHLNQQWYQQRQSDFRLIATGFQALKAENENRALQTNQLVQWLIQQQGSANPVHSQKIEQRKK